MKTYWKWAVLLAWVATSALASNRDTNDSKAGPNPAWVNPFGQDVEGEQQKQRQAALKSAQAGYRQLLEAFPHVKQIESSYNRAKESYDRTIARETGPIKAEMFRLQSLMSQERNPHLDEYRRRLFEISGAIAKSLTELENLKQQVTNLSGATNDTVNTRSDRATLEGEIANARQKLQGLIKTKAELAPENIESLSEKSSNQKALEQKYGLLQRQLWDMPFTNTNIISAKTELVRWKSELESAITTNAPLKEAKHKLESAYK